MASDVSADMVCGCGEGRLPGSFLAAGSSAKSRSIDRLIALIDTRVSALVSPSATVSALNRANCSASSVEVVETREETERTRDSVSRDRCFCSGVRVVACRIFQQVT